MWQVPAGTLAWGRNAHWQVQVKDAGGATSETAGPVWLSPQVPQPAITGQLAAGSATASARGFDAQTGNALTAATDLDVAISGPPLSATRTHNSLDPRVRTAFGAGWSSPFDMTLAPDGDGSGNVVITFANGQQTRFGRNDDGTFSPPPGRFSTLRAVAAGGWALTDKGGTTSSFDAGGRLTRVTDPHGRAQLRAYAGDGTLRTVTDQVSGRSLTLDWSGGHVTKVATSPVDDGGRVLAWTYAYDGDRLVRACPPTSASACTTYGYTTGSHYPSVVA